MHITRGVESMRKKIRTTVTIRHNQKAFIKRLSKENKDWNLSGFIQDKLDELMHKDSNQLERMIQQKQKTKQDINQQIDKEIEALKQRHQEQRKKEEAIKQRKQAAMPKKHYDYGT